MKKDILNTFKILLAAIVLSLGISYVYAWTAPTLAPPGGNVEAPINSGLTPQTKKGRFTSNSWISAALWISTPYLAANTVAVNNNITAKGNLTATNVYTDSVTATGQVKVGSIKFANNTVQTTAQITPLHGSKSFKVPGSYTWIVPAGITTVSINMSGGGDGGSSSGTTDGGGNITAVPSVSGTSGGDSYFGSLITGAGLVAPGGVIGGPSAKSWFGLVNGINNGGNATGYGAGGGGGYGPLYNPYGFNYGGVAGLGSSAYKDYVYKVIPGKVISIKVGSRGVGGVSSGFNSGGDGAPGFVNVDW